jgi:hypothetical protein
MGNKILWVMAVLVSCMGYFSCTSKFYAPNQVVIPNLQQKNDMMVTGNFVTGNDVAGVNLAAAYSPVNYLGISGSYSYFSASMADNPSYGHVWDLSIGTYIPRERINYEFYAGYGRGFNHQFLGAGSWGDFNVYRIHGQGSLVVNISPYFRFFSGLRLGSLHFTDSDIILSDQTVNIEDVEFIQRTSPFFLVEPSWGFYLGTPGFYLVMQRTSSYSQLSRRQLSANMSSIGIHINPVTLFKKDKQRPLRQF